MEQTQAQILSHVETEIIRGVVEGKVPEIDMAAWLARIIGHLLRDAKEKK